jgi:hypothetical protein
MRGGRRAAEGPGGAEVATAANINSTRRSEKVKVLGRHNRRSRGHRTRERSSTHLHASTKHAAPTGAVYTHTSHATSPAGVSTAV